MRCLNILALAIAVVWGLGSARADGYPDRAITIVVPFAAGSGSDTAARVIGQRLSVKFGQPVVIENKIGATGAIASAFVARAKPDGYTLLLGTNSTHGSNSALYKALTYDPIKDFEPIAHTGDFGYFLVVDPKLPIRSVAELVVYGKSNPGKLSCDGGSSTSIVMAETFAQGTELDILRVPYRSNPTALTDVMSGRVSMMFVDISTAVGMVKEGNLRAIAVTSAARSTLHPDLPTIDETAIKGFDLASWTGLFAPSGTPRSVLEKLNLEVGAIVVAADLKAQFAGLGIEPKPMTFEAFKPFVANEVAKWTDLVRKAKIEVQ
jgi:tripartite-type tricarboxylate transporter receptor subunit TctC